LFPFSNPSYKTALYINCHPPASIRPFLQINTDQVAIKSKYTKVEMLANSVFRSVGEGNNILLGERGGKLGEGWEKSRGKS